MSRRRLRFGRPWLPDRVIADAPLSTAMRMEVPPVALEERLNPLLLETMQTHRPRGARFAWAMVEGQAHREIDQPTVALPFLDHCIRLRYPADADPRQGPVTLKSIPLSSGWVADNSTWQSGLTKIAPCTAADASGFPGWKQIALYNGAQKLAEITQGLVRFAVTDLSPASTRSS